VANVRTFRDLVAYQKARLLSNGVHRFTRTLPQHVQYEVASQVRRAATSVRLNIAEGFGTGARPAMLRHLRIARGSLFETDAGLEEIGDLGLGNVPHDLLETLRECDRVLQGLIRSMEQRNTGSAESQ
jgi:four helix bundle protein